MKSNEMSYYWRVNDKNLVTTSVNKKIVEFCKDMNVYMEQQLQEGNMISVSCKVWEFKDDE